ncbi:hypothetical protein [Streptomyces sp. XC 2026]|uniref:hypothetical protein n=1 Tax=Streptomyces sp. XC 2026 TaxID=2782004 RepID=UPI0019048FCB|nr:hypothetical protein [Streptomyces sp. XC 2026]QQN79768.1 hypothetical protein IPZ77_21825 [Streptomyces sp. XC 2026]QQN80624.1 hypothetical protein IPZ77_26830 [Streptomyces sp. XC 2026]
MTVSLCKHRFPVRPPLGSFLLPGDCTHCGLTHADYITELLRQDRALIEGTARDGECAHCGQQTLLYRWQAPSQPWDEPGDVPLVQWLCASGYDTATTYASR